MDIQNELLESLKRSLMEDPVDYISVCRCATAVLEQLIKPNNFTKENCDKVNYYIMLHILDNDRCVAHISMLPDWLRGVIEDMGMFLHDACSEPRIAEPFGGTPFQLLHRLKSRCIGTNSANG